MRKALNENRTVQILLVGGLAVFAALFLLKAMGGEETPAPPASTTGATGTGAEVPVAGGGAGTPATATPDPAAAAASGAAAGSIASATSVTPEALEPGPGLPAPVANAWKDGDTVVLLIVKPSAVDDRAVTSSVRALSSRPGVSVFIAPANKVARYSRITQAVGVNRVPALIVLRPKRLSGAVPQALVSYGFRGPQSVNQALKDALYSGKDNVPYYPR